MNTLKEFDYWYALFTITGDEDNVKERICYRLKNSNIKVIVPKRKLLERKNGIWSFKIRTLFPGYIFLNGFIGFDEYYLLNNIPGLIKVLKNGYEPYIIDKREMQVIKTLINDDGVIEPSSAILCGKKIIIKDGPLVGLEGKIASVNKRKGRVKIRLSINGIEKLVELSISVIETV